MTYFLHILHIILHIFCHILHIVCIFLVIFCILFCIFIFIFYILHIILHIFWHILHIYVQYAEYRLVTILHIILHILLHILHISMYMLHICSIFCIFCNESDQKQGCTNSIALLNEQVRPGPLPAAGRMPGAQPANRSASPCPRPRGPPPPSSPCPPAAAKGCGGPLGRGAPPLPAGRGGAGVPGRAGREARRASRRPPPPKPVARPPRQWVAGSACQRGGAGRGRAAPARRPAARRPPRTAPAPPLVCAKHSGHIPRGNTRASPTRKDRQTPA